MPLDIQDVGTKRVVMVDGEQMDGDHLVRGPMRIETDLSSATLEELSKVTGDTWLVYNIRRISSRDVIADNITAMIEAFPPSSERPRFLDFGCGFGASTLAIARMGYEVVGVDCSSRLLGLAERVCSDCGAGNLASLIETADTENLPFDNGEFDAVVASGVFEHIRPDIRTRFVRECWRVIKPGGVLYVMGTPNRLWPIEGHTTGLPLVHWLPLWLAVPVIRRLCKRVERNHTREQLLDGGLVGVSLFGLLRSLDGSELCVRKGGSVGFYFSRIHNRGKRGLKKLAAGAIVCWFGLWEKPLRLVRVPVEAFFPCLNVAIKKRPC